MTFAPSTLLIQVFSNLRRAGFRLGLGELLDAVAAIQQGWGVSSVDELKRTVRLLWCNSIHEMAEFDEAWAIISLADQGITRESQKLDPLGSEPDNKPASRRMLPNWKNPDKAIQLADTVDLRPVPVRPAFDPIMPSTLTEPDSYLPVSRRSMAYIWRYLRRPLNDGPMDLLNVEATVANAARQGFYLAPVFGRRTRNYAHLILLVDRGGSMVPFHRFARNVVETARYESDLGRVEVFYFHNALKDYVFSDPFLTEPVSVDQALEDCAGDTSLLIISDAGAARGFRKTERIRTTAQFLFELRVHTQLIAWLNPLPEERWTGTSAQIISHLTPMFQMDDDGLSNAVDVIRGQSNY